MVGYRPRRRPPRIDSSGERRGRPSLREFLIFFGIRERPAPRYDSGWPRSPRRAPHDPLSAGRRPPAAGLAPRVGRLLPEADGARPQRRRRPRLVRGRHRRRRTRLRSRPRPHRRLLHAAVHGFRRRLHPRWRRRALPLPDPGRRAGIEVRQPPLPLREGRQVQGRDGRLGPRRRRLRHGRGRRRREQRRPARRAAHRVRPHPPLPQPGRRQVRGRDRRIRTQRPALGHVRRLPRLRPRRAARPRRRQLPRLRSQKRLPVAGGQEGLLRPEHVPRHVQQAVPQRHRARTASRASRT